MKKLSSPQWLIDAEMWVSLGLIVIISALTYLPLSGQLGIYREGWYLIWAGRTQTLSTFVSMYSVDRPIVGYIYTRLYLLLGDNPFTWQIFSYLLRLTGAIGFFWLLRLVWPKIRFFTTTAAILFIVYPGFLQWPNAVVYCTSLLSNASAIYSILFTVIAIRINNKYAKVLATALAILCQVGYLFIDEYILGLEGLRLIFIWYLTVESPQLSVRSKRTQVFLRWVPYLPILGGFLFWRLFIFQSVRPTTNVSLLIGQYASAPFAMTQKVVIDTLKGFLDAILLAWTSPLSQFISITRNRDLLFGTTLAILVCASFWLYSRWMRGKGQPIAEEAGSFKNSLWISLITVFCAILPVTVADRSISFFVGGTNDRYTLHTSMGGVLLIVSIIFLLNKNRGRLWLLTGLLFLSILTQYSNAVYFRNAWKIQQQLWWQLAWRSPQFEDGTVLMITLPSDVFSFSEDYEVWAPANIIYNHVPKTLSIYSEVLYPGSAIQVMRGATGHRFIRNIEFDRDFNHALIISIPSTLSCVHAIDGEKPELSLNEPPIVDWVAPYSHIQQIETDVAPSQPPEIIFGKEPSHTWCYYYQRMSLAQQQHDWDQVVALGEEALNAGFKPLDPSEWMPLIEGYAYSGDLEKANSVIAKIYDNLNLRYNLCASMLKQKENPALNLPDEGVSFLLDRLCGIR